MISVLSFYYFVDLAPKTLEQVNQALLDFAVSQSIRGLAVTGLEGINATLSGPSAALEELMTMLSDNFGIAPSKIKIHHSEHHPFRRFKLDCRPEIVTIKSGVKASEEGMLSPSEWHQVLQSGEEFVLVDVRNKYETALGVFEKAVDPQINKFSEFGQFVEGSQIPKDQKILMYCTGGIRCEKAAVEMRSKGYAQVYQLEGGILKYMEEFPGGFFSGECFVFDHRVALDQLLKPSTKYRLCPHCGNPGSEAIVCAECAEQAVVCQACLSEPSRQSCSKNCAYHQRKKLERQAVKVNKECTSSSDMFPGSRDTGQLIPLKS